MSPESSHQDEQKEALATLLTDVIQCYFALRATIEGQGMAGDAASGSVDLLRSLAAVPPKSMADIARDRGVSRQYIQKLATELNVEGWISFQDNPRDKRSRLVVMTPDGQNFLSQIDGRLREFAAGLSGDLPLASLQQARAVMAELKAALLRCT
jgi:DNA-binding MarR family transcriptional regulator